MRKHIFLRVDPEFHKRVKVEAARRGESLQEMVTRLLATELQQRELQTDSRRGVHVATRTL